MPRRAAYRRTMSASAGVARSRGRAGRVGVAHPAAGLHLPRTPADVVLRPRLFELLGAGSRERALTLVSGPAGAGKTVLLASWLRERPPDAHVAWLSLQEGDCASVWSRLSEAVAPARTGRRDARPAEPGGEEAAAGFIEVAEGLDRPLVVVVDDLHHAPPSVLADLDRILRSPPAGLHFVAASRLDP